MPDFDVDLLFHSYFAQAEALLHDLFDLLTANLDAKNRQRYEPMRSDDSQQFWRIYSNKTSSLSLVRDYEAPLANARPSAAAVPSKFHGSLDRHACAIDCRSAIRLNSQWNGEADFQLTDGTILNH